MTRQLLTEAFPANANWPSGNVRTWHAAQSVQSVESVTELRSSNMELTEAVMVRATGAIYVRDAASTEADDGESVIHDMLGRRYVRRDVAAGALDAAVTEAEGYRDEAEAFAAMAVDARDIYPDAATGLAAVADGKYYWVASAVDGELAALYRDVSGVATDTGKRAPDNALINEEYATSTAGHPTPAASGSIAVGTQYYFWPSSLKTYDQMATLFEIGRSAQGCGSIAVAFVEGDGSLTLVSNMAMPRPTGLSSVDIAILVPAGCVIGFGGVVATYYTSGASETSWYTSALPTTSTAKTVGTTNAMKHRFTLKGMTRTASDEIGGLLAKVGGTQDAAWAEPIVGTGSTAPAYTVIGRVAAKGDGRIRQVKVGLASAQSVRLSVVTMAGLVRTPVREMWVTGAAGVNIFTPDMPIAEGQYWEVAASTGLKYQSGANPEGYGIWYSSSVAASGATMTASNSHRFEIGVTIDYGLTGAAADDPLAGADNTGVADATAIFTAATATAPHVFVPPGKYALTAAPARDAGLWGDAEIRVNSIPYVIPAAPTLVSLMTGAQNVLAEFAANNDVLALVSDSRGHWAYAPTGAEHWFNGFTQFVNYGAAADEPIMTALRPSSTYTPDFYGVTGTGGTTGTNGPLGESLILAAGESRAFTGTYETLGLWYEQASGAGTITVKRGATTLATINAAGATEHDKHSGDIATGVTASASYTIEVTGAAVEITALGRFGVKTSGRNRLRTARFAHGSYAFASFTATRRASMAKICSAWGGKIVPILDLGTNDQFTVDPATIVTNADAMADDFVAAGAPRLFSIPPNRPSSAWAGSYTGGRTYDGMIGPLRRYYRQNGITIIPVDTVDLVDAGGTTDGLHGGATGQWLFLRAFVESLVRTQ